MFQHSFMTFPMCFVLVLEVKCFHVKIIANSHAVVRNNTKRFMYILPRFPNGVCMCAKLLQSYLTLHDPVDYSPPGSSVHGILQARILEWIAMPSSFPNGNILQTCSTISQPECWCWCNKDTGHFHHHLDPSSCPFIVTPTSLPPHLHPINSWHPLVYFPFLWFCHFKTVM